VSPLFGRLRGGAGAGDPAAQQAQAQRDQDSLERLAAGRIPLNAAERLATLAATDPSQLAFASDLSVQEYALLHSLGITPITLVMGSSIYQVGWQGTFYMVPTEIQSLSHAYNESRRLALNRLLEETTLVGADAVVGVRIEQGRHDFASGSVEFVAIGTAVRLPPALRGKDGPVLTDLEGQEFWQLCTAGIRPVGIAAHTSVHYVPATWQTARAMGGGMFGGSWYNQELGDFTQGVYDAREKAMTYVTAQASALGADGIIGVKLEEHASGRRVSRGGIECDDMIITFHVIGTAVREDPSLATDARAPRTILSLA
jgi:uncharacterized protein YbjQ (UPF0145 family)